MSGTTDDSNMNNLGPGGVNDPGEAELRRRVNQAVGDALTNVNFRSRRSAIMTQIRDTAKLDVDASTSGTPLAVSPRRPETEGSINDAADNVRSFAQARAARPRNFLVSGWGGALAAALVILLVGGLALLLLNNQNNTGLQQGSKAIAPAANSDGLTSAAAINSGAGAMAAATTSAATTMAALTTSVAASIPVVAAAVATTSAAATTSAITSAAATTAAAATTTSAVGSGGNSSGGAATTAAAGAITSAAAASAAQTAADQSNLPLPVVNTLPIYPGSDKLNLDNSAARSLLLGLLQAASGSINQSLNNNELVLLNVSKVKAADLPQWYADRLKDQNFKLTVQNNAEASTDPSSASLDWRVFTSNTDPKQSLTYFFLNVKNSSFINGLLGPGKVADGDTIVLVFGRRRS